MYKAHFLNTFIHPFIQLQLAQKVKIWKKLCSSDPLSKNSPNIPHIGDISRILSYWRMPEQGPEIERHTDRVGGSPFAPQA